MARRMGLTEKLTWRSSTVKRPKAVYDPMKTPTGQALDQANENDLDNEDHVGGIRDAVETLGNRVFPQAGTRAVNSQPAQQIERMARSQTAAPLRAAQDAYERQRKASASGFAQHLGTPGEKSMEKPATPYQPRMTDPVSGQKLQKGRPVPAANASPSPAPKRVKDPGTGEPLVKGQPVPTAYSGALNQKVGLGLRAAGGALKAGFGSPDRGAKAVQRSSADAMQEGFDQIRQVGEPERGGKKA